MENGVHSSTRRALLGATGAVAALGTAGVITDSRGRVSTAEIELKATTSGWIGRRPDSIRDEVNPTLSVTPGTSYRITWVNGDGIGHKLQILDASGSVLHETAEEGTAGNRVTLEATAGQSWSGYRCSFHPGNMAGDVAVTSNEPPSAAASVSPTEPSPGETVQFDATGSSDPDGSIASYEWDFGDGTTAAGTNASHAYGTAGTYDVVLTVVDDDGAAGRDTISIAVRRPDDRVSVTTAAATDVGTTRATLVGSVEALGGHPTLDTYFVWRERGARYWNYTSTTPRTSGRFAVTVAGLAADTTYEYRAVGECAGGEDSGRVRTVSTTQ